MALIQQVKDGKFIDETTGTGSTSTKSSDKDKKTNELGYDQFLQILCAEMQYQDPLEPTSNTEYIAQLATFSQLESQLSVQSTIEASSANDLVGKYVIMKVTSSTTGETSYIAGTCDYVLHKNGETFLSVNDGHLQRQLNPQFHYCHPKIQSRLQTKMILRASVRCMMD